MAKANLDWRSSKAALANIRWIEFKNSLETDFLSSAESLKTVYIIRLGRPYAIAYHKEKKIKASPVIYIGRGKFKQRMRSHLNGWLHRLATHVQEAKFKVLVSTPKARRNSEFYKDVEADLIDLFEEEYGNLPLKNRRHESHRRQHTYDSSEITKAFGLGSGPGYQWAIYPIGSNRLK